MLNLFLYEAEKKTYLAIGSWFGVLSLLDIYFDIFFS